MKGVQFTGAASLCGVAWRGAKERASVLPDGYKGSGEGYGSDGEDGGNAAGLCPTCGDWSLSPFLGERMLADKFLRRSVVVRELMPQDLKLEIDQMTRDEAVSAARYLAAVVGRAHARQMTLATRRKWIAELRRNRSKSLDAPGWMWRGVVELIADHETAYLEHCRQYAMTQGRASQCGAYAE
jgi:hypothetical protein